MKTLFVLAAAVLAVSFACVDKVDNIIKIADLSGGSLNVQFANVLAATYDANGAPACSGSHPDVRIPGQIKLISGQITVKKQMDLVTSSDLKLTVTKDSWLIGTVCKDGEKKNPFVPDGDCQVSLCGEANKFGHGDLCKIIDTPGVHTLENLEGDLKGFNGTIVLPPVQGMIAGIIKGTWKVQVKLVSHGQTIANVKAPSNEEWIQVE